MHLCFSITAHGFGHGAISCSVINRIMMIHPDITISVMSLLPQDYIESRLTGKFNYYNVGYDFGMLMLSPINVDVEKSRAKYQQLSDNWTSFVDSEKQLLNTIKPDILISNISPISLDAANQLGIKTASVAPFNWAQIYRVYCLDKSNETQLIYQKMKSVYQSVDQIFKPLPYVPTQCGNEIPIASINDQPVSDLPFLLQHLPDETEKIGLLALGGLPFSIDLENWPKIKGLHWLVDQEISIPRVDMSDLKSLNIPFLNLVASCDFIITKPGYGTYCEIASLAKLQKIRVMSLERPDWPETPFLNSFLSQRVPFVEISEQQLIGQSLQGVIKQLNEVEYPAFCISSDEDGAMQMVERLLS